jgi:hypothetical protein
VPRALTIQRTLVPSGDRRRYLDRARQRKSYYASAKCEFWIFEEASLPGAFVEFTEAPDAAALAAAHAGAPDPLGDAGRVYVEVELK